MLERSFGCLVSVLKRKIGEYHIHNWGVRRLFAFLRFCIYSNPNSVNASETSRMDNNGKKIEANDSKTFARNWRQPETSMKSDFTLLSITREKLNFHELFKVLYLFPSFFQLYFKKRTSAFLKHFRYLFELLVIL